MPVVRKVVSTRVEYKKPEKIAPIFGLKEFYEKRNKILITRGTGGLGDILMHRMIFEDFHKLIPDVLIHFACPKQYVDAVNDHPFIDKVFPLEEVKRHDYIISYVTTTACGRYELKIAPRCDKHRSDIWAEIICGLNLTNHEMHFRLTEEEKREGKQLIESKRNTDGPAVLLAPISAMQDKNLSEQQILGIVQELRQRGCYIFGLHNHPIYPLLQNDIPTISKVKIRQWLGIVNQADYIISVDTSQFHCAGGMKKPVVGLFTFANGLVYGQYYPTAEIVQGPCPVGYNGCFNWTACPARTKSKPVPCCTELKVPSVMEAFDRLVLRST